MLLILRTFRVTSGGADVFLFGNVPLQRTERDGRYGGLVDGRHRRRGGKGRAGLCGGGRGRYVRR